jgi:hypothetical protein
VQKYKYEYIIIYDNLLTLYKIDLFPTKCHTNNNFTIQVVTEKTPLHGDIIGISTFCNVNAFGHVILKRHNKIKKINSDCNIPRLLLVSGRTEENVNTALKKVDLN